jgi:hypothetical protein
MRNYFINLLCEIRPVDICTKFDPFRNELRNGIYGIVLCIGTGFFDFCCHGTAPELWNGTR